MRFFSSASPRTQADASTPEQQTPQRRRGNRGRSSRPLKRRSPLMLFLLLLLWSAILGLGLAQAGTSASVTRSLNSTARLPASTEIIAQTTEQETDPEADQVADPDPAGLVDPIPEEHRLGQELYLENCATCHVGLPPAVMPTESWREILTKPYHYGAQITPLTQPSLQIAWNYVSLYSRPLKEGEDVPFRLRSSRYFKVLHPKVSFPEPVTVRSCVTCHPAAAQFNYRSLTPEWENAP